MKGTKVQTHGALRMRGIAKGAMRGLPLVARGESDTHFRFLARFHGISLERSRFRKKIG